MTTTATITKVVKPQITYWHVSVIRAGWGSYSGSFETEQDARAEMARQVASAERP